MPYFQHGITVQSILAYAPGLTLWLNIYTCDKSTLAVTWNKISN